MAWRATRQARSALRSRSAAAAIRLGCGKIACIQWARTAPRELSNARPMTMPAAALTRAMLAATQRTCTRGALRDAVRDEAEDPHQRKRERHGREDAKQYGEEPLAAVLCGLRRPQSGLKFDPDQVHQFSFR